MNKSKLKRILSVNFMMIVWILSKSAFSYAESGTISYLDMLLSSESLSDFISKYYIISELAEFDEELLEEIQNAKEQIITEKESLEVMKINVENTKTEIENKKNSLTVSAKSKKS